MPNWSTIGIPGGDRSAGTLLGPETIDRVVIPHDFVAAVLPLLTPGVVMLVTDARMTDADHRWRAGAGARLGSAGDVQPRRSVN